jgi:hypothetical protein
MQTSLPNRDTLLGAACVVTTILFAGVAATLGDSPAAARGPVSNDRPAARPWTPSDVLSGREAELGAVRTRGRSGELGVNRVPALRGGGTMDIGDIAVLEDDGTLVGADNTTDIINITNAFLATHPDDWDQLVVFTASNFPGGDVSIEAGFAFHLGLSAFESGTNNFAGNPNESGGITRLRSLLNMNDLNEYPGSAETDFLGGVASGVEIIGQEMEHAWGSFVTAQGADILGRGDAHWSFFLHHPGGPGSASPMEGNLWTDNGGGSFTTTESFSGFSQLDHYLMGLRTAAQVDPFYVIDFANDPFSDSSFPSPGTNVSGGTRIDLTVADIIANHGVRLPDPTTAPSVFRMAFVLVIPQGTTALQSDLDKLNAFRTDWIDYFSVNTDGLGEADTSIGDFFGPGSEPFIGGIDFEGGASFDDAIWEWNQGVTVSDLGLNEPSGSSSMRLNGGPGGGDEIRSRFFDLSGFPNLGPGVPVSLNYSVERTGGADSPEAGEDLLVEYWSDAGEWVVLRTFAGNGLDETDFTSFSDALPADALHTNFRFRFHRLQGSVGEFDDYFVDDISITLPSAPCPGDLNGDNVVDTADLGILIGEFGIPGALADLNEDGTVDTADLGILIGVFGTSCN